VINITNTFFVFQCCDVDVECEIAEVTQSEPLLLVTSQPGTENSQIFVSCEGQIYVESKSLKDAILNLMPIYFIYNIVFST